MKTSLKITSDKVLKGLFALCWLAYFSTYLGRLDYAASLTEIIRSEGFDKGQAGLIGTAFFLAYGIGQLVNGFLGDRLAPKWMIFAGTFGSGLCNLAMIFLKTVPGMAFVWCINGFLQSLIWSPIIKIFGERVPAEKQKHLCVHINSSVPVGTFAAYGIAALIIWKASWRIVFLFSSAALLLISVIWLAGMGKIEAYARVYGVEESLPEKKTKKGAAGQPVSFIGILLGSGVFFIGTALMLQGILKDGVTTWIPTYISEVFRMNSAASIISTTLIPAFNLGGVYMAGFVNRKLFPNEMTTAAFFFTVCLGALFILRLASGTSMLVCLLLFAAATTAMMAVNTMLVSVVPIYFASCGKASTVCGILNSSAYIGGALSTYGIGVLTETIGWNKTISIWVLIALAGILACGIGKKFWDSFTKPVQEQ